MRTPAPCPLPTQPASRAMLLASGLTRQMLQTQVGCDGAVKYADHADLVAEKVREDALRELGNRFVRWLGREVMATPAAVVGLGLPARRSPVQAHARLFEEPEAPGRVGGSADADARAGSDSTRNALDERRARTVQDQP
jgi:hypothetical protein